MCSARCLSRIVLARSRRIFLESTDYCNLLMRKWEIQCFHCCNLEYHLGKLDAISTMKNIYFAPKANVLSELELWFFDGVTILKG